VQIPYKLSCLVSLTVVVYLTGTHTSLVVIPHCWSYLTGSHTSLVVIPHLWSYLIGSHTSLAVMPNWQSDPLAVIIHCWRSYLAGGYTSQAVITGGHLAVLPYWWSSGGHTSLVVIWRSYLTGGHLAVIPHWRSCPRPQESG
jgi:hypothetical protein